MRTRSQPLSPGGLLSLETVNVPRRRRTATATAHSNVSTNTEQGPSNPNPAKKSTRRAKKIATRRRTAVQNASQLAEESAAEHEVVSSDAAEQNAAEVTQSEPLISFSPATQDTRNVDTPRVSSTMETIAEDRVLPDQDMPQYLSVHSPRSEDSTSPISGASITVESPGLSLGEDFPYLHVQPVVGHPTMGSVSSIQPGLSSFDPFQDPAAAAATSPPDLGFLPDVSNSPLSPSPTTRAAQGIRALPTPSRSMRQFRPPPRPPRRRGLSAVAFARIGLAPIPEEEESDVGTTQSSSTTPGASEPASVSRRRSLVPRLPRLRSLVPRLSIPVLPPPRTIPFDATAIPSVATLSTAIPSTAIPSTEDVYSHLVELPRCPCCSAILLCPNGHHQGPVVKRNTTPESPEERLTQRPATRKRVSRELHSSDDEATDTPTRTPKRRIVDKPGSTPFAHLPTRGVPYSERRRRREIEEQGRIHSTLLRLPELVAQTEADARARAADNDNDGLAADHPAPPPITPPASTPQRGWRLPGFSFRNLIPSLKVPSLGHLAGSLSPRREQPTLNGGGNSASPPVQASGVQIPSVSDTLPSSSTTEAASSRLPPGLMP
jgi:hypothetical protein